MKFVVTGDSLFSSRNLARRLQPSLVERFQQADAVFTNAEFCTPKRTSHPAAGRGYITSVPPDILQEFVDLNIRLVNFAHNHTGDFGIEGMLDTMEAAEKYGIQALGVGKTLDEARKARFYDGRDARIGIVAAGSTRSEVFAASNPGNGVEGRPGSSPLRWNRAYVLPEKEFQQLKAIDEKLGTAESYREGARIETFAPMDPDHFKFGSLFEGSLLIEKGEKAHVRTYANSRDQEALLSQIRDAARRSDFVLASLHTHEGLNENWYADEVPEFIEEYAHRAIEAGASAFVGHGAHFMRGVEIYQGKPIFYNLGSLLMEFEAGESIICPEMYEAYGYGPDAVPSDLHGHRIKDRQGKFIGFGSERKFSLNILVSFTIQGKDRFDFEILPLDLDTRRDNPLQRGLPFFGDPQAAREVLERLEKTSNKYHTRFVLDESTGVIRAARQA